MKLCWKSNFQTTNVAISKEALDEATLYYGIRVIECMSMSVSVFLWPQRRVSASVLFSLACVCVSFRKRFSLSFVAGFFLFFFFFSFSGLTRGRCKNSIGYEDDENDNDDDNTMSSSFFFFLNFVLIFFNVILPQIAGESSDAMPGKSLRKSLDNFLNFFTGFRYALATLPPLLLLP